MEPRGFKNKLRRLVYLSVERMLAKRTDAILTMNAEDYSIARKYSLSPRIESILGMGVLKGEAVSPREQARKKHGADGKRVLFFAGELSSRKNQNFLINAMPRIRERHENTVLWLAGDGAHRDKLRHLAKKLGVEREVILLGRRDDVRELMAACDVYVSASRSEITPPI